MIFNGAYSAEKGYDLRTPYNVPMGEVRSMRVVPPFSVSSLQKNVITEKLGLEWSVPGKYARPPTIPPTITSSLCTYDADWNCSSGYTLKPGNGLVSNPSTAKIMRLVYKNTRIK